MRWLAMLQQVLSAFASLSNCRRQEKTSATPADR
jgi:hypothetical protein